MKVRFAAFHTPIELPGKSSATHVHEHDPALPGAGGWDLSVGELAGHVCLRVSVPEGPFARGVGAWVDNHSKRPLYGLGRVCYIPIEQIKKLELASDAEPPKAPAAPPKK